MSVIKDNVAKVKNNPLGAIAGVGAGYLVATKLVKTEKMWMKVVISLVGGVAGAMVQAKMKARKGVPTAQTVTGK